MALVGPCSPGSLLLCGLQMGRMTESAPKVWLYNIEPALTPRWAIPCPGLAGCHLLCDLRAMLFSLWAQVPPASGRSLALVTVQVLGVRLEVVGTQTCMGCFPPEVWPLAGPMGIV